MLLRNLLILTVISSTSVFEEIDLNSKKNIPPYFFLFLDSKCRDFSLEISERIRFVSGHVASLSVRHTFLSVCLLDWNWIVEDP